MGKNDWVFYAATGIGLVIGLGLFLLPRQEEIEETDRIPRYPDYFFSPYFYYNNPPSYPIYFPYFGPHYNEKHGPREYESDDTSDQAYPPPLPHPWNTFKLASADRIPGYAPYMGPAISLPVEEDYYILNNI